MRSDVDDEGGGMQSEEFILERDAAARAIVVLVNSAELRCERGPASRRAMAVDGGSWDAAIMFVATEAEPVAAPEKEDDEDASVGGGKDEDVAGSKVRSA
ncbi:hypothetical protein BGX33_004673 [Mortierella sp. NVP41]|nr:hypothetical protein BGX33_004673 [Mortierella sp. NVP41]